MTETGKRVPGFEAGADGGRGEGAQAVEEWQLSVLRHTYPGWRIRHVRQGAGGWWATRRVPPTAEEREAGVVPSIARADAPALAEALAVQDDICHRLRWPEEAEPGTERPGRRVTRVFAAERASVAEARRWMRTVLDGHSRRDDAVLLLSEAFANAVAHTRSTRIEVTVLTGEDGVVAVQVADQGSETVPYMCRCVRDEMAESGRGIGIIRAESERWGFTEEPAGGLLWFELAPKPSGLRNAAQAVFSPAGLG
ncbi:ATP-binding protein [Thermopolyspora sp. NPDC052614]|uniref:ATP-binding protein n=1 Tax=Thermopolyspora sp. NPDC052614 TaxID=3155682 RepID=UPI00343DE9DB